MLVGLPPAAADGNAVVARRGVVDGGLDAAPTVRKVATPLVTTLVPEPPNLKADERSTLGSAQ